MRRRGKLLLVIGGGVGLAALVIVGLGLYAARNAAREEAEFAFRTAVIPFEDSSREKPDLITWGEPVEPTPEEAAEFAAFFENLGRALNHGPAPGGGPRLIDERAAVHQMLRYEARGFGPAGLSHADLRAIANSRLRESLPAGWDRTVVRRVRWSADRRYAIVVVRQSADPGGWHLPNFGLPGLGVPPQPGAGRPATSHTRRWWLAREWSGWTAFDAENLPAGLPVTTRLYEDYRDSLGGRPRDRSDADELAGVLAAIADGDTEIAEEDLAELRDRHLHPDLAGLRAVAEGLLRLHHKDPARALEFFDEAARLDPDLVLLPAHRARALAAAGRPAEAIEEAKRAAARIGPDALALVPLGVALRGLGQTDEAAASFRNALDDDPDSADALTELRRLLPAGGKGELAGRVAKAGDPADVFERAAAAARADNDEAGMAALLDGLRKAPDTRRAAAAELRFLIDAGKFADAADALRRRLADARGPEDRRFVLDTYVIGMAGAGKSVEAYAEVPDADAAHAFRTLAMSLDPLSVDQPAAREKLAERLRTLIAAHRKRVPDDPWLHFYDAALLEAAGEYEKAADRFASGAVRLELRPGVRGVPDEMDRARFRSRRVACLYKVGRGREAYEDAGPIDRPAVFRQLAELYAADRKADGLRELVAAHRAKTPDDRSAGYWLAEAHFIREEYAAAAAGFGAYRRSAGETDPERSRAAEKLVRSLLRSGNAETARSVVEEAAGLGPPAGGPGGPGLPGGFGGPFGGGPAGGAGPAPRAEWIPPGLEAAVFLACGDEAEADHILADQKRFPGGLALVYSDPDFARVIAAPEFAHLRQKYPDPRPKKPDGGK